MSLVSVSSGGNRYENVRSCLEGLGEVLHTSLVGKRRVLIKPNFVSTTRQAASSHVDAARAVLDVISDSVEGTITIAEGAAQIPTSRGFRDFNFEQLLKSYDIRLLDLNTDESVEIELFGRELEPVTFRIARTVMESDYRISLALPKMHDTVVVTLAIKNMGVGALLKDASGDEKMKLHQGCRAINMSIAKLAKIVPSALSVIDGFEGMEGEGPELGNVVKLGWAMAGFDGLAVDTLAAHLMGIDPAVVGYLVMCREDGLGEGNLGRIRAKGVDHVSSLKKSLKFHSTYEKQLTWR